MKKALVFCSIGLGDGLLFSLISKNLHENKYEVDTFHPFLYQMRSYFPYMNLFPYPEDLTKFFKSFDAYDLIIINSDYTTLNKEILKFAKENFKNKTFDLHPSTCKGKNPPLGDFKFDFKKNILENFKDFSLKFLKINDFNTLNRIFLPINLEYRKYKKRVVIHPLSKESQRNWPEKKFFKLYHNLKKIGFDPYFILAKHEKNTFEHSVLKNLKTTNFENIKETTNFIYESGYMIGNDSGIAHLASFLKIPTLTIASTRRKKIFWSPNLFLDKSISSLPLINIKGLRIRDKYWDKTITQKRVLKHFKKNLKKIENENCCI